MTRAAGWPARLTEGPITLRPIRRRDARCLVDLHEANIEWLKPWEATTPEGAADAVQDYRAYASRLLSEARSGWTLPWVIEYKGAVVGQMTISGITRGALQSGFAGYWVSRAVAGHGIAPTALAMAFDHATGPAGLHRIEVSIRPENVPSLRVVDKLGFRDEGERKRYLHVGKQWADHRVFALTVEDVPDGLLARWRAQREGEAS